MFKVAAALLLELAVLRLIGLVVSIIWVTVLGIAHAKPSSLWVLLANVQAIEVLALSSFIWLGLVHLPMLIVGPRLKWLIIKYELSVNLRSFELRMTALKLLSLWLVILSLKLLLSSVLICEVSTASIIAYKTSLLREIFLGLTILIMRLNLLIVIVNELGLAVIRHLIIILVVPDLVTWSIKWLRVISTVIGSVFIVWLLVNTMFFMILLLLRWMSIEAWVTHVLALVTFLSKIWTFLLLFIEHLVNLGIVKLVAAICEILGLITSVLIFSIAFVHRIY